MGIKTFLPTLEQFEARQKAVLYEFEQKYNLSVPRSENVLNVVDLQKALQ